MAAATLVKPVLQPTAKPLILLRWELHSFAKKPKDSL